MPSVEPAPTSDLSRRTIVSIRQCVGARLAVSYNDQTTDIWWPNGARTTHTHPHQVSPFHSVDADGTLWRHHLDGAAVSCWTAGRPRTVAAAMNRSIVATVDDTGTLWVGDIERALIAGRLLHEARLDTPARTLFHAPNNPSTTWVADPDGMLWRVDVVPTAPPDGSTRAGRSTTAARVLVDAPVTKVAGSANFVTVVDVNGAVWDTAGGRQAPFDTHRAAKIGSGAVDVAWRGSTRWVLHTNGDLSDRSQNVANPPGVSATRIVGADAHLLWWVDDDEALWATLTPDDTARIGHPDDPMFATFWSLYASYDYDFAFADLVDAARRLH